ncbi:Gldg family protein [Roseimaritima sediminicola]|uniref:Gldg family protein n=1 Tax=Roseimaritima sediminicola TaxID=2662066 RepID=UPI0012983E34|nr:Gldg family protein [Roseimaritima sediminicola]
MSTTLGSVLLVLVNLLLVDLLFLALLAVIVAVLAKTKQAAFAVMRRNFVGYFSNPTGYVFLCIFVFLTSLAAFWPYEFFNQNLATLDQLNGWFPLIMLVFIPAITMSIWAEEKRQGTDELLLTLPADDFDIVIGKYMSAAAIFTASLLFSQLSTFITLAVLTKGEVDTGLIFTTYLGYWFVGLAMLSIGMIASFLTGNLTVGFILGALFNAPLAFASLTGSLLPSGWLAKTLEGAGIATPFDDFGRGVVSTSSVLYFVLVTAVSLYVCMILIGRRHWTGGKDGNTMAWHYLARVLALVVFVGGTVVLFRSWDVVRIDATEGDVSSLSPTTKQLIRNLDAERPIVIDAFISDEVPEQYARTKYQLINLLKEFRSEASKAGRAIEVNLYDDIELFSDEAQLAEDRFGIVPVTRIVREKGALQQKQLILGAAMRSGLNKVTIPILEYGIPVEYELVRSIKTVSQSEKKRLGIVSTDARLMGGVSMGPAGVQQSPQHPLIEELSKQYDVEEVTFDAPVQPGQYDALIAVQPSTLTPERFNRFLEAVRSGVPTAVFEDPFPATNPGLTPTGQPKQQNNPMMMGRSAPTPKGNIRELWDLLELDVPGEPSPTLPGGLNPDLVWQTYNPYPNLPRAMNDLFVFIDSQAPGGENSLGPDSPITRDLQEVLLIYAGAVQPQEDAQLKHTKLLETGALSGRVSFQEVRESNNDPGTLMSLQGGPGQQSILALAIESDQPLVAPEAAGEAEQAEEGADADETSEAEAEGTDAAEPLKVVYVADSDLMIPDFLLIRADPNQTDDVRFQMENVSFLLNVFDWLSGEHDFIAIRSHKPYVSSLALIEDVKQEAALNERNQVNRFQEQADQIEREADAARRTQAKKYQDEIDKLQQNGLTRENMAKIQKIVQEFQHWQAIEDRRKRVAQEKEELDMAKKRKDIRRQADGRVESIQNIVKATAVTLPCIPPLVVGIIVFSARRLRERENIAKSRLR